MSGSQNLPHTMTIRVDDIAEGIVTGVVRALAAQPAFPLPPGSTLGGCGPGFRVYVSVGSGGPEKPVVATSSGT